MTSRRQFVTQTAAAATMLAFPMVGRSQPGTCLGWRN